VCPSFPPEGPYRRRGKEVPYQMLPIPTIPALGVPRLIAAVVLVTGLALPSVLEAQQSSAVVGVVRDETSGVPVEGATVTLVGREGEVVTTGDGLFYFPGLVPGPVTLRVARPGYITVTDDVDASEPGMVMFEVRLPQVNVVLQELFIERESAPVRRSQYEVQGHERFRTALDYLAYNVPGVTVSRSGNLGQGASIRVRGVGTFQSRMDPLIFIDGIKVASDARTIPSPGTALDVLQMLPADQVARVRVLTGSSAAAQYPEAASGVILIETVKGGPPQRQRR
jgi:hypothetical protein